MKRNAKNNILVTSYANPDLDGTACAIGYAEFLQKTGVNAIAAVFGTPHREAEFVLKQFSISRPQDADHTLSKSQRIVLVDASDLRGISSKIDPINVIELIDHRQINEADHFRNAKIQIELVGSAATLIAEKFFTSQVSISTASAVLLYSAIISNTVNFQANVTTERDKRIANWLLTCCVIPENYIHDMFAFKSIFEELLINVINHDFATFEFNKTKIGIGQLEIVHSEKFIKSQLGKIQNTLEEIKKEKGLDIIFLSVIDIEKVQNIFITIDELSKNLLIDSLHVVFNTYTARKDGIMMRKTITPLLRDALLKSHIPHAPCEVSLFANVKSST